MILTVMHPVFEPEKPNTSAIPLQKCRDEMCGKRPFAELYHSFSGRSRFRAQLFLE